MVRVLGVLACLALAVPFAGAGGFAAWLGARAALDAERARDWVLVKADVVPGSFGVTPGSPGSGHFAYAFEGRRFEGRRLDFGGLPGSRDIDAWRADAADALKAAKSDGRSISVWVDPDDPSESVLNRRLPWDVLILGAVVALGVGGTGLIALGGALALARGREARIASGTGPQGAAFFWIFGLIWNAVAYLATFLVIPDVLESREWGGLFVLLFPFVGLFVLWAAAGATVGSVKAWVERSSPPRPASRESATVRGLVDRPMRSAGPGPLDLPASIATVTRQGQAMLVRFSPRRRLALTVVVLAAGCLLTLAGAAMMASEGPGVGPGLLLVVALAADLGGVSLLTSRLEVLARPGEIAVDRGNLFGRATRSLRPESVRSIRPVLSYTVNGVPVFTVRARTSVGEDVVVGDSFRGETLAERYAAHLAAAAGVSASLVRSAAQSAAGES